MKGILTILSLLIMQISFAQTPYLGGEGDGYAVATLQFDVVNSISELESTISIYPTVARPNQQISISTLENIQSISLVDVSGHIYRFKGSNKIVLPNSLQPGLYTVIIALNEQVYYSKIVVINS